MRWLTRRFRPNFGKYSSVAEYQGFNFSECGPAALATLIKQQRKDNSVSRFTCRSKQVNPSWWTRHSIITAGAQLGIRLDTAHYNVTATAGIYLSSYAGFGHWVVAWRDSNNRIQVLDPKRGHYILDEARFKRTLKSYVYVASTVRF